MKKFTLCLTLAAFSVIPALQAGEGGCCPSSKQASTDSSKQASTDSCPMSKQSCPAAAKAGTCSKAAAKAKVVVDTSAKGATQLVKK